MKPALDTFLQADRLRRADAALGRWLARAFPEAAPEVALAAALAARAVGDGHSALELARAADWFARLDGHGKPPALPDPSAWQVVLRAAAVVHVHVPGTPTPLVPLVMDAAQRVYLRRYFEYECAVARKLAAQAAATSATGADAASRADGLDPEQQLAVATALTHRLALITGGPGSGKTFSVAHILAALVREQPARIALAAPTGKAAARLAESLRAQVARMALPDTVAAQIPRDAATLHRLLGITPWRAQPRHHAGNPLPFDVVVVDEASMIDLPLMARLLDAIAPAARLVLLGDPDQLSAVEAGSVLPALVEAAGVPPLAGCHVALATSHRFGGGSALATLAQAMVAGDADAALAALPAEGDVRRVDVISPSAVVDATFAGYAPVFAADHAAEALAAARGFRVLSALRHGPYGCIALDRAIGARLKRAHGLRAEAEWWPGRLVMITANRDELGLYNGDTGLVWPDVDGTLKVWFEGSEGTSRAFAPAALPPHEGAFALTVHKAQGSEFERVALVTGPESPILTRELLYTGVTRARAGIVIHADADTLRAGIANRTLRMTGLADRLREAGGSGSEPA